MYHVRFKGTHYEAGFRFGSNLRKNGIHLLNVVPFPMNEERIAFAKECEPCYLEFYPEILDEIRGIADGQSIEYERLLGILLSMYCILPEQKCTNVCLAYEGGNLLGRNSDFLTSIEKYYMNCIYRMENAYAFTSNTTAFVQMEDGINEHGLAIGFTSVYPTVWKPGMNAGMIVRYLLEKCKDVEEAIARLHELPIASSQTLALMDAKGKYVIIESNCEDIEVLYPNDKQHYIVSTNAFHSSKMKKYNPPVGTIDDWRQEERYQDTMKALCDHQYEFSFDFMKDLLSGKYGFICQYDRSTGADTVWSVIYDSINKKIYRVEGNPGRKHFVEDTRFIFH